MAASHERIVYGGQIQRGDFEKTGDSDHWRSGEDGSKIGGTAFEESRQDALGICKWNRSLPGAVGADGK